MPDSTFTIEWTTTERAETTVQTVQTMNVVKRANRLNRLDNVSLEQVRLSTVQILDYVHITAGKGE